MQTSTANFKWCITDSELHKRLNPSVEQARCYNTGLFATMTVMHDEATGKARGQALHASVPKSHAAPPCLRDLAGPANCVIDSFAAATTQPANLVGYLSQRPL